MNPTLTLTGNVVRDPELKDTNSGKVCSFAVAVSTSMRDPNGEGYITNFYNCSMWGKQAEYFFNRCQKGSSVTVSGGLVQTEYQAKDGTKRPTLQVSVDRGDVLARIKMGDKAPVPASGPVVRNTVAAVADEDDLPM